MPKRIYKIKIDNPNTNQTVSIEGIEISIPEPLKDPYFVQLRQAEAERDDLLDRYARLTKRHGALIKYVDRLEADAKKD